MPSITINGKSQTIRLSQMKVDTTGQTNIMVVNGADKMRKVPFPLLQQISSFMGKTGFTDISAKILGR